MQHLLHFYIVSLLAAVPSLHGPVHVSIAGGTTQATATTAQPSLLAPGLGGDRTSANFSMFKADTTVVIHNLVLFSNDR